MIQMRTVAFSIVLRQYTFPQWNGYVFRWRININRWKAGLWNEINLIKNNIWQLFNIFLDGSWLLPQQYGQWCKFRTKAMQYK